MGDFGERFGDVVRGLLSLEINTIVKPGMMATRMPAPEEAIRQIASDYWSWLAARAPETAALPETVSADYVGQQAWIGFHDDMFPEDTDGPEGWKFLPLLRESKRVNNWKRSVVGGEMVFNGNKPWLGEGIETTRKRLSDAHFTWIGPYCPALESPPNEQFTKRANELVRRMGYQFTLKELRHAAEVKQGGEFAFSLEGENQGVAPFYYPWRVELALLDGKGKLAEKLSLDCDIRPARDRMEELTSEAQARSDSDGRRRVGRILIGKDGSSRGESTRPSIAIRSGIG